MLLILKQEEYRLLVVVVLLLSGGWIGGCEEHPTQFVLQPAARAGGQGQDGPFHQYPDPYTAQFWAEPIGGGAIRVHTSAYRYVWKWANVGDLWLIEVSKVHPTGNVITSWYGNMPEGDSAPSDISWMPEYGAPPAYTHP